MTAVVLPGRRDVRGTFDEPDVFDDPAALGETDPFDDPDESAAGGAIVVACPPHPRHGGRRSDGRLVAVSDELAGRGIGCLRFDYGSWDEGRGEREDVRNAVRWATDRAERVGVFGYSFGASEAILGAATVDRDVVAVAALAPTARLGPDLDVVGALEDLSEATALQVAYGSRDTTVDWEPVVDRARERDAEIVELSADHFFVGQQPTIAERVGDFFETELVG